MEDKMRDIDVIRIIIDQVRALRIPVGEEDLTGELRNILHNLAALESAMAERDRLAGEEADHVSD